MISLSRVNYIVISMIINIVISDCFVFFDIFDGIDIRRSNNRMILSNFELNIVWIYVDLLMIVI